METKRGRQGPKAFFFSVSEKIPILSYQTTLKSKHTRARAHTRVTHIYIFTDKPMDAISI